MIYDNALLYPLLVVGNYVTGRRKRFRPIEYIYSWSRSLPESNYPCPFVRLSVRPSVWTLRSRKL